MSDPLDILFSPERLRSNWDKPEAPAPTHYHAGIHACHDRFLDELKRSVSNHEALDALLKLFNTALVEAFPNDKTCSPATNEQRRDLVSQIERLEELIWALELGARAGR